MVGALREEALKAVRTAVLLLDAVELRAGPGHPSLTQAFPEWDQEQEAVAPELVAEMLLPPAGKALNGGSSELPTEVTEEQLAVVMALPVLTHSSPALAAEAAAAGSACLAAMAATAVNPAAAAVGVRLPKMDSRAAQAATAAMAPFT